MPAMQVPPRRQRAANDNCFPVPVPARCREYGKWEVLRRLGCSQLSVDGHQPLSNAARAASTLR